MVVKMKFTKKHILFLDKKRDKGYISLKRRRIILIRRKLITINQGWSI